MWKEAAELVKSLFQPQVRRWACGAAFFVGGVGLLAPATWFSRLRLASLSDAQRTAVAAAALIGFFGLVVDGVSWLRVRMMKNTLRRLRTKRLHKLTPDEKRLLCGYILANQRTQYFHVEDGVVTGLESEEIIYRASSVGRFRTGFAFNIQPWAWDYLHEHPELIVLDVPTNQDGYITPYQNPRF